MLILAPTRELAAQIREEVFSLSKHMYIRSLAAFGGMSKRKQIDILRSGPQIVVGTPGRILDLMDRRFLKPNDIKYFILDEVDRMLDMGFIDPITEIWNHLDTVKQVLTYSATLPKEVTGLIEDKIGKDYTTLTVEKQEVVVDTVDHMFMHLETKRKYDILEHLLRTNQGLKTVVFVERKVTA